MTHVVCICVLHCKSMDSTGNILSNWRVFDEKWSTICSEICSLTGEWSNLKSKHAHCSSALTHWRPQVNHSLFLGLVSAMVESHNLLFIYLFVYLICGELGRGGRRRREYNIISRLRAQGQSLVRSPMWGSISWPWGRMLNCLSHPAPLTQIILNISSSAHILSLCRFLRVVRSRVMWIIIKNICSSNIACWSFSSNTNFDCLSGATAKI